MRLEHQGEQGNRDQKNKLIKNNKGIPMLPMANA
jgi:hypothetical protein